MSRDEDIKTLTSRDEDIKTLMSRQCRETPAPTPGSEFPSTIDFDIESFPERVAVLIPGRSKPTIASLLLKDIAVQVLRRGSHYPRPRFVQDQQDKSCDAKSIVSIVLPEVAGNRHHTKFMFLYNGASRSWEKFSSFIKRIRELYLQHVADSVIHVDSPAQDVNTNTSSVTNTNTSRVVNTNTSRVVNTNTSRVVNVNKRRNRQETCITCSADVDSMPLSCGAYYCDECLENLVSSGLERGRPLCYCDAKPHLVKLSRELFDRIPSKEDQKRIHRAIRKNTDDKETKECPICQAEIKLSLGSKVYSCSSLGCMNPHYGYCVECDGGISDPATHSCVETNINTKLLREYLAQNGIMPCPSCGNAAEKQDSASCNHMTCLCSTRYCGACGSEFGTTRRGGTEYNHRCVITNVYNRADDNISRFYENAPLMI